MLKKICLVLFLLNLTLLYCSCAPVIRDKTRFNYNLIDDKETKQGVNIVLELPNMENRLNIEMERCNYLETSKSTGETKKYSLFKSSQVWINAKIINNTGHTIILRNNNGTSFIPKLKTPQNVEYVSTTSLNDEMRELSPCSFKSNLGMMLYKPDPGFIKAHSPITPGSSVEGLLLFKPTTEMVGNHKLIIYDVPVLTDMAGNIQEKQHFEFNINVKKYIDTYQYQIGKEPILLESQEISY